MVSEAKKPLVLSMAFLALFSAIILSVGAYMVFNNLKSSRTTPTTAIVDKTDPVPVEKKSLKDTVNNILKMNRAFGGLRRQTAPLSKEVQDYCDVLDELDGGIYHTSVPAILKDWEDEDEEEELNIVDGKMIIENKSIAVEPAACKIFDLTDAFGISGSKGKFGWYSKEPTEIPCFKSLKEFLVNKNDLEMTILVDKMIYFNRKPCHVVVVGVEQSQVFSDDNLLGLIDHLLVQSTPWPVETITSLNMPNLFGVFAVLSPEDTDPSNQILPTIAAIDKQSLVLKDILHSKNGLYFGKLRIALHPDCFKSMTGYLKYMKTNGLHFIGNDTYATSKGSVTVHYATSHSSNMDLIRANLDIISSALLEYARRSANNEGAVSYFLNNPELKQLVFSNDIAFLLLFHDAEIDFEAFGPCEFESKEYERTITGGLFYSPISKAKVFKIYNYKRVPGQVAHRLALNCEDATVLSRVEGQNGTRSIEIRGVTDTEMVRSIVNATCILPLSETAEGVNFADRWVERIYEIVQAGTAQVTIWTPVVEVEE